VAGEGDEVMFAWRSFEAYPSLVRIAGATPVMVPLDAEHRHDLDAMLAAITERTRLVFVCNPNNPTGTVVGPEELERFVAAVPRDVLVVIDEAYVHFDGSAYFADAPGATDPSAARASSCSAATRTWPCCTRSPRPTGSQACGSATPSRPPRIAAAQRKVAVPFGVTDLAQAAAVASLDAQDELAVRIAEVAARDRLHDVLVDGLARGALRGELRLGSGGSAPSSSTGSCTRAASSPAPSRARACASRRDPPRTSTASRRPRRLDGPAHPTAAVREEATA
jgi:histidinol-phosphate aminotransferase